MPPEPRWDVRSSACSLQCILFADPGTAIPGISKQRPEHGKESLPLAQHHRLLLNWNTRKRMLRPQRFPRVCNAGRVVPDEEPVPFPMEGKRLGPTGSVVPPTGNVVPPSGSVVPLFARLRTGPPG